MPNDNPYPAPAPLVLAKMCAKAAWKQNLPDSTRLLLEWAADAIRDKCREANQLRHDRDQAEADAAHLFALHYGPQKGGAA
jgi:hypothetical protein